MLDMSVLMMPYTWTPITSTSVHTMLCLLMDKNEVDISMLFYYLSWMIIILVTFFIMLMHFSIKLVMIWTK
jgi:hypothetical protein